MARAEVWAIAGATIGVPLARLTRAADPAICVLGLGALAAQAACAAGGRRPQATLTARLLLASVYVAAGTGHPMPLGLAVAALGASFGGLAWWVARRSERAAELHAPLTLSVRSADSQRCVAIELPGGASARYAARRAAAALGVESNASGCWLERDGARLAPNRSLLASGVGADDDLTLVTPSREAAQRTEHPGERRGAGASAP